MTKSSSARQATKVPRVLGGFSNSASLTILETLPRPIEISRSLVASVSLLGLGRTHISPKCVRLLRISLILIDLRFRSCG